MSPKHTAIAAALCGLFALPASADPGVFLGLAYTFGDKGGPGITLKVTSSKKEDRLAAAIGVTWYPNDKIQPIGFDVGAAYLFDNWALAAGWDFLHSPQISVLGGDTSKAAPAPSVGPIPGPV
jgi:hypothetical protein